MLDEPMVVYVDSLIGEDDVIYQSDTISSEPSTPMHTANLPPSVPPPSLPTAKPSSSVPTPPPPSGPTPALTPSESRLITLTSAPTPTPPSLRDRLEPRPRTTKSTKRSANDMACNNKKTAVDEALEILKSSLPHEPPREDFAFAAGIINRTWLDKHPRETQVKWLVKLTTFIAEAEAAIMAENEMKN